MKKVIIILIGIMLIGVLTLEIVTFIKMLGANVLLPEINYLRMVK